MKTPTWAVDDGASFEKVGVTAGRTFTRPPTQVHDGLRQLSFKVEASSNINVKGFWLIPLVIHRQVKCNIEENHLVSFVRQLPTKPLLPKAWRVTSPMKLQLRSDQFLRPRGGAEVHSTVKLVLLCASGKGGVAALSWRLGWAWQTCLVTKQIPCWGGAKVGKSTVSVNLAFMFGRSEHSAVKCKGCTSFVGEASKKRQSIIWPTGKYQLANWIQIERSRAKEALFWCMKFIHVTYSIYHCAPNQKRAWWAKLHLMVDIQHRFRHT